MTTPNLEMFAPAFNPAGPASSPPSLADWNKSAWLASVRKSIPINDRHPRAGLVHLIAWAGILWAFHDSNPLRALHARHACVHHRQIPAWSAAKALSHCSGI